MPIDTAQRVVKSKPQRTATQLTALKLEWMKLQDGMGCSGTVTETGTGFLWDGAERGLPLPIDLYKQRSNGTQIGWLFGWQIS